MLRLESVVLALVTVLFLASDSSGCGGLPGTGSVGGAGAGGVSCPAIGAITCRSPTIPKGEMCCMIATGRKSSVGYLCAYGADKTPAGCFSTLEEAHNTCYAKGVTRTPVGIVRCAD